MPMTSDLMHELRSKPEKKYEIFNCEYFQFHSLKSTHFENNASGARSHKHVVAVAVQCCHVRTISQFATNILSDFWVVKWTQPFIRILRILPYSSACLHQTPTLHLKTANASILSYTRNRIQNTAETSFRCL